MNLDDTERKAAPQSPSYRGWRKAWHRFLVTAGFRGHPRHEAIRRNTLDVGLALLFACGATSMKFGWAERLGDSPLDLDIAYRAVAHGWFTSDHTLPVTLVEIDERTYRGWGQPPFTPREPLRQLLEVVTAAEPLAVVVDIDLSWGDFSPEHADPGAQRLREFLEQYKGGATLIFPKRIDSADPDARLAVESPLDDVFERNDRLAWAHASVETGSGGAVRSWQDWLAVCVAAEAQWLPSVSLRVMQAAPAGSGARHSAPSATPDCADGDAAATTAQRLLVGPGFGAHAAPRADARVVSAALLLDPEVARDDAALFGRRVVVIGATHPGSGDFWLTPGGVRPGVEMVANAIRYAPVQEHSQSLAQKLSYRALALFLFGTFVLLDRKLRGILATVLTVGIALATIAIVMSVTQSLAVFDALEAAILLIVAYKALDLIGEAISEVRRTHDRHGPGWRGWRKTAVALCRREP